MASGVIFFLAPVLTAISYNFKNLTVGGGKQVVEHMPSNCEALISNLSTEKKIAK
jgi:hypothetical protein